MTRHEDIERYLSEEMSGDERLAFENELKSNPALREETALYASTAESLHRLLLADDNEQQLRKKLHPYRAEYFSAHKKDPKIRALPLIRWAAAAAIFTAIWIWSPWNTNSIREYGTITMPPLTERSADSVNGVAEAAGLFNEKEYEQALPLLNKDRKSVV